MKVEFTVNGSPCQVDVPGARRLLDVLREDLGLTGTKEGCGEGECGACSVLIGDEVVNACLIPVGQVDGASIMTIEGLEAAGGKFLQDAFITLGAAQCGLCTPGMLLAAYAFYLRREKSSAGLPDRQQIRAALAGNLCRCTGYQKIVDAVHQAYAGAIGPSAPRADFQSE